MSAGDANDLTHQRLPLHLDADECFAQIGDGILNLLVRLQEEFHLTYLFVSHDMSVVRYICDRIAVMYAGRIVELGPKADVLSEPRQPYTELLLAAVPRTARGVRGQRTITPGEPPDLSNLPSGCVFRDRCKYAQEICAEQEPLLQKVDDNHFASCHFADSLDLEGIRTAAAGNS